MNDDKLLELMVTSDEPSASRFRMLLSQWLEAAQRQDGVAARGLRRQLGEEIVQLVQQTLEAEKKSESFSPLAG